MHKCDNPPCCNPAHLSVATQSENLADMHRKGRWKARVYSGDEHWSRKRPDRVARGEQNGSAKLTEAAVRQIRIRRTAGARSIDLATEYGVSKEMINSIVARRSWGHVE
jgi:hypothetical protein